MWFTPSSTDLQPYLAAPQLEALQNTLLADGQTDPLPDIIADVVARVRAEIRAYPPNRLSASPDAVPPELRGAVAHLALEAAQTRIPSFELTADQRRAADNARHLLTRIAGGHLRISQPDDPEDSPSGPQTGRTVTVNSRPSLASGNHLAAL